MKSNYHIFYQGRFISSIQDVKVPPDAEIIREINEYYDFDLSNETPKFQTHLTGKGIEFIQVGDYERLTRQQRQDIVHLASVIEAKAFQTFGLPTLYQQTRKNLFLNYKVVASNDHYAAFLGYRGSNFLIDLDRLSYDVKVYVHSRMFDFFNTEPHPQMRIIRQEQITKYLNDSRFEVLTDSGYCIVKYNDGFYFINILQDFKEQTDKILDGSKRRYDSLKDLRNHFKYEKFLWLKTLGFLEFRAHVYYNGRKVVAYDTNFEPSNEQIINILAAQGFDRKEVMQYPVKFATWDRPPRDSVGIFIHYQYI